MRTCVRDIRFTLVLLLFLCLQFWSVQAAPGDLDSTFNGTGTARLGFGGRSVDAVALAVAPDSKLVLAGYAKPTSSNYVFAVARLDTNNVPDPAFGGGDGILLTSVGPQNYAQANAVCVQADGKVIAAGEASDGYFLALALVRYNPDGSLDSSFGNGGEVITDVGDDASISAMALQPDGKIVVAGDVGNSLDPVNDPDRFLVARYQTNGTLDASFGSAGIAIADVNNGSARGVTLEPSGQIVAAGEGNFGGFLGPSDIAVARFSTNGVLDSSFGGTGVVFTHLPAGSASYANAVAIQPFNLLTTQKILVAGTIENNNGTSLFALARYNDTDGSLDTTFGSQGVVSNSFGPYASYGQSLFAQVQGGIQHKIIITLGGYEYNPYDQHEDQLALARFNADGSLNTAFGTNGTGKVVLPFTPEDAAYAMAYQSGKIVLGGVGTDPAVGDVMEAARFNSDGTVDSGFGANGAVVVEADLDSHAQAVAMQPDGKVVVAGMADNGQQDVFALVRYNADGVPDDTFGIGGRVAAAPGSDDGANAIAIQPNGAILAAGYSSNGHDDDFAVLRYTANGTPDTSFNGTGQVRIAVGASNDLARAVALQPDGKIVLAGESFNGAESDFALVRCNTNGTLDTSFGGTGKVTTAFGSSNDVAEAVLVQPDGKLVAAGYTEVGLTADFALARYDPDGALDQTFGSAGKLSTDFGSGRPAYAYALALQPDGRLLAAGTTWISGNYYLALARYQTNGALDTSFGSGGKVIVQVGHQARALAVQSDGKILIAGVSLGGANNDYAVLRFEANGALDSSYGIGGESVVSFSDGGSDTGYGVALDQVGRAVVAGDANSRFGVARLASEPYLRLTSISHLANGAVALQGLGYPGAANTLQTSPSLNPASFSTYDSVLPDAGGFWQYQDTNTAGVNTRFYRLAYP